MIQPIRNNQIGLDYLRITENKAGESVIGINNEIQPVINIERYSNIVRDSAGTIYTTPTDKDFYITSVWLSQAKSIAETGTKISISITVDGLTQTLIAMWGTTGSIDNRTIAQSYRFPVKIDKGTTITVQVTGTYGVQRGGITGFTVETKS